MALYLQQSWAYNLADQSTNISNLMNKWSNELTSGMRITQNGDADAYEIYMNQENTATSLTTVKNSLVNASSALSLAQTSFTKILSLLNQAKQLAIKAENNANGSGDYTDLSGQWDSLLSQSTSAATGSKYNGQSLLLTIKTTTNSHGSTTTSTTTYKGGLLQSVAHSGTGLIYATDGAGGQGGFSVTNDLTVDLNFSNLATAKLDNSTDAKAALKLVNTAISNIQSDLDEVTTGLNKMQFTSENLGAQICTTQKAETKSTQTDYSSAAQSLALVQSRQTTLIEQALGFARPMNNLFELT